MADSPDNTVLVHVTMFEDPIEVLEDEVEVLRAQGLLREAPQPAPAAVEAAPAPAPAPALAKATPKSKESA